MSFSGDIPLPPTNPPVNGDPSSQLIPGLSQTFVPPGQADPSTLGFHGTQPYPYDANTMAYYQAYYAQMAATGYAYPTSQYPVPPGFPQANYLNSSVPLNSPSSLHPLLQHQANASTSVATTQKKNEAIGKKQNTATCDQEVVEDTEDDDPTVDRGNQSKRNVLSIHGNEKTMNLNSLLLTNIQQSLYFKTTLYGLKNINELLDEIWYNVKHMEPWERGSRQVGVSYLQVMSN
jgi:hypothetical protein